MTAAFISQEAQNNGMTVQADVVSVLSYLQGRENYAVVGKNATAIYLPNEFNLTVPFEAVGSFDHPLMIAGKTHHSDLFSQAIVRESVPRDVRFGDTYQIRVPTIESLITVHMVANTRYGLDASLLIKEFGKELNFEEIRCMFKGRDNYEELYSSLTRAFYELVHG